MSSKSDARSTRGTRAPSQALPQPLTFILVSALTGEAGRDHCSLCPSYPCLVWWNRLGPDHVCICLTWWPRSWPGEPGRSSEAATVSPPWPSTFLHRGGPRVLRLPARPAPCPLSLVLGRTHQIDSSTLLHTKRLMAQEFGRRGPPQTCTLGQRQRGDSSGVVLLLRTMVWAFTASHHPVAIAQDDRKHVVKGGKRSVLAVREGLCELRPER